MDYTKQHPELEGATPITIAYTLVTDLISTMRYNNTQYIVAHRDECKEWLERYGTQHLPQFITNSTHFDGAIQVQASTLNNVLTALKRAFIKEYKAVDDVERYQFANALQLFYDLVRDGGECSQQLTMYPVPIGSRGGSALPIQEIPILQITLEHIVYYLDKIDEIGTASAMMANQAKWVRLSQRLPEGTANSRKAQQVWCKALDCGMVTEDQDGFVWTKPQVLLVCLCGLLYCGDRMIQGQIVFGKRELPVACLEKAFNTANLKQARQRVIKSKSKHPRGLQEVLQLFE